MDCFVAGSAVYGAADPGTGGARAARAGPPREPAPQLEEWLMFTGIVEEIGEVLAVRESADVVVLTVRGRHGHR